MARVYARRDGTTGETGRSRPREDGFPGKPAGERELADRIRTSVRRVTRRRDDVAQETQTQPEESTAETPENGDSTAGAPPPAAS